MLKKIMLCVVCLFCVNNLVFGAYVNVDSVPFRAEATSTGLNDRYDQLTDGLSDGTKDLNMLNATFNNDLNISNDLNVSNDGYFSGEIGIGTTAPLRNLQIKAAASAGSTMCFTNDTTGGLTTDGFVIGITSAEIGEISLLENTDMTFVTNSLERMRIKNDGKVGIGTTAPNYPLHLDYNSTSSANFQITHINTGRGAKDGALIGVDGALNLFLRNQEDDDIVFYTNDEEKMRIKNDGKVGIGTTAPGGIVEIQGTSTDGLAQSDLLWLNPRKGTDRAWRITGGKSGDTAWNSYSLRVSPYVKDSTGHFVIAKGQGSFMVGSGSVITEDSTPDFTKQFEVTSANVSIFYGEVGIGTTAPNYLLDVAGTANISEDLIVGGTISTINAPALSLSNQTAAFLERTTDVSTVGDGVYREITWETKIYEYGNITANISSDTIYLQENGFYNLNASVQWDTNGTGTRGMYLKSSGGGTYGFTQLQAATGNFTSLSGSTTVYLTSTMNIKVYAFQNTGSSLDITSAQISIHKLY